METISIYIYNQEFMRYFVNNLYSYFNKYTSPLIYIQKSIQGGDHVNITLREKDREFERYLNDIMSIYNSLDEINTHKMRRYIQLVANSEGYEPNTDIKPDGTILTTSNYIVEKKYYSPVYSKEVYKDVLVYITKIALYLESIGFFEMKEDKQNIILSKLFLNLGLLFNNDLRYGYLSMKSNILYFNSQLESIKNRITESQYLKYYNLVNHYSYKEKSFINEEISSFLTANKDSFFYKIVKKINEYFYTKIINGADLYSHNLSSAESFFDNSKEIVDLHKFHKTFFSSRKFINYYKDPKFLAYKYTADSLYKLLPQLHVTPIRRQKITKIVSDKVEANYNLTWEKVFEELNNNF